MWFTQRALMNRYRVANKLPRLALEFTLGDPIPVRGRGRKFLLNSHSHNSMHSTVQVETADETREIMECARKGGRRFHSSSLEEIKPRVRRYINGRAHQPPPQYATRRHTQSTSWLQFKSHEIQYVLLELHYSSRPCPPPRLT